MILGLVLVDGCLIPSAPPLLCGLGPPCQPGPRHHLPFSLEGSLLILRTGTCFSLKWL